MLWALTIITSFFEVEIVIEELFAFFNIAVATIHGSLLLWNRFRVKFRWRHISIPVPKSITDWISLQKLYWAPSNKPRNSPFFNNLPTEILDALPSFVHAFVAIAL